MLRELAEKRLSAVMREEVKASLQRLQGKP
jgi:hypothetical protein